MPKPTTTLVGRWIGQIRVTGILGEGGMGTVYAGFHERLQRDVALKLIRADQRMSGEARGRFLREARLLSRLNHPNVCRVHDLLETPDGDLLVLEKVSGGTLREKIEAGLSREETLSIARQLLEVLAAVHRQGIVHRDLKPENVMVQPDGSIKVLDFGLARRVDDQVVDLDLETLLERRESVAADRESEEEPDGSAVLRTSAGTLLGTLRYMSPEQVRGEDATPASDMYAMGLILQEMATGRSPYPREIPPVALAARVAYGDVEVADELPAALRSLIGRLTSLSPADRPSARDALDRLDAILDAPKRRRRRAVLAAAVALLTLLAAGMTVQWVRASREADRARRSLAETREVSAFLEELFQLSNPFVAQVERSRASRTVTAEELLLRGTEMIRERFASQPEARARFMMLLGRIQRNLGHHGEAADMFRQALEARRAALPGGHPDIAEALRELGQTEVRRARYEDGERHLNLALRHIREHPGENTSLEAATLESLALLADSRGRTEESRRLLTEVVAMRRGTPGGDVLSLALTLQRLGMMEISTARYDDARRHLVEALRVVRSELGADHPSAAPLLAEVGRLEAMTGDLDAAARHYREALDIVRGRLPDSHPLRATLLTNLANTLESDGELDRAEPLYREALELKEASLGPDHPQTAQVVLNLALLEHHRGRAAEAERLFGRAEDALESKLGARHPFLGMALLNHGVLEQDLGRHDRARRLYARALEIFLSQLGSDHPYTAMALNNLAEIDRMAGRLKRADERYRRALAAGEKVFGEDDPSTAEILRGLAITCALRGETDEARELFDRAETILDAAGRPVDRLRDDRRAALDGAR